MSTSHLEKGPGSVDDFNQLLEDIATSTKRPIAMVREGRLWKQVIEETEKLIREETNFFFDDRRGNWLSQLQKIKSTVNEENLLGTEFEPRAKPLEGKEIKEERGEKSQKVAELGKKIERAPLEDRGVSAPTRGLLNLVVQYATSGALENRDAAREMLVKEGVSKESCDCLTKAIPLLIKNFVQQICLYSDKKNPPPEILRPLFAQEGDIYKLNGNGQLVFQLFGVGGEAGLQRIDEGKVVEFSAFIEANFFRIFSSLMHRIDGNTFITPQFQDVLRKAVDDASKDNASKKKTEEVSKDASEITEYLLKMMFPKGGSSVAAPLVLDRALYLAVSAKLEEKIKKSLLEIGSPSAAKTKETSEEEKKQPFKEVFGNILTKPDAQNLMSLVGDLFLELIPIPGLVPALKEQGVEAFPSTGESLSHAVGEFSCIFMKGILQKPEKEEKSISQVISSLEKLGILSGKELGQTSAQLVQDFPKVLEIYEGKALEPKGMVAQFFVKKDGVNQLSPKGMVLLTFLTGRGCGEKVKKFATENQKELCDLVEKNTLLLLYSFCFKLNTKQVTLPKELLTGDQNVRKKALAEFMKTLLPPSSELSVPSFLEPLKPILYDMITPVIEDRMVDVIKIIDDLAKPAVKSKVDAKQEEKKPLDVPLLEEKEKALFSQIQDCVGEIGFSKIFGFSLERSATEKKAFLPRFVGEVAQVLIRSQLDVTKCRESAEYAKKLLRDKEVRDDASIEAFSSIATSLPEFLRRALLFYDKKEFDPPPYFMNFFDKKDGKYFLNEVGSVVLISLEGNTSGLGALAEANIFTILNHICDKLTDSSFKIPKELFQGENRGKVLADFLLKESLPSLDNLSLLPVLDSPEFKPVLIPFLVPIVEKMIEENLPTLDAMFQVPLEPEEKKEEKIPQEIFQKIPGELLESFKPFGSLRAAFSEDLLAVIPGFSLLSSTPLPEEKGGTVSQFFGDILQVMIHRQIDFKECKRVVNDVKAALCRKGVHETSLEGFSSTISQLFENIGEAKDQHEKPSKFLSTFFSEKEGELYHLNPTGLFIQKIFKESGGELDVFIEANVLLIVDNLIDKLKDPSWSVPGYVLEENKEKELVDFLLQDCLPPNLEKLKLFPVLELFRPVLLQLAAPILVKVLKMPTVIETSDVFSTVCGVAPLLVDVACVTTKEHFRAAKEKARQDCVEKGIEEASLAAFSNLTTGLPQYLLTVLPLYEGQEPPPLLAFFFEKDSHKLNDIGKMCITIFKNNSEDIGQMLDATMFSAISGLSKKLENGEICVPPEALNNNEELLKFLLSSLDVLPIPGAFKQIMKPLESIIAHTIAAKITESKTKVFTPLSFQEKKIVVPEITKMTPELENLANSLGDTVLENVPEFAPLMNAIKKHPAPRPVISPITMFVGDVGRVIVDGITTDAAIKNKIAGVKKELDELKVTAPALEVPKQLLTDSCRLFKEGLAYVQENPTQEPPAMFQRFVQKKDDLYELNDTGLGLVRFFSDEETNIKLLDFIELNFLSILKANLSKIVDSQSKEKYGLLDTLSEALRETVELIKKNSPKEDEQPALDVSLSEFNKEFKDLLSIFGENILLPQIVEDLSGPLKQIFSTVVDTQLKNGLKKADSILMDTVSDAIVNAVSSPFLKFFNKIKNVLLRKKEKLSLQDRLKKLIPKEVPAYARSDALRENTEDLIFTIFPEIKVFKGRIQKKVFSGILSTILPYTQIPAGSAVDALLLSVRDLDIEAMFKKPVSPVMQEEEKQPSTEESSTKKETLLEFVDLSFDEAMKKIKNKYPTGRWKHLIGERCKLLIVSMIKFFVSRKLRKGTVVAGDEDFQERLKKLISCALKHRK